MTQTMSHLRVSAVLFVLSVLAIAGCNKSPAPKPAADTKTAALAADKDKKADKDKSEPKEEKKHQEHPPFELDACKATLRLGKTFRVASDKPGTDPVRVVEIAEAANTDATAPTIHVTVFAKAADQKIIDWLKKRPDAPKAGSEPKKTGISGTRVFVTQSGTAAAKTDTITFGCSDKVMQISVGFDKPDAALRQSYSTLIGSLKIGSERVFGNGGKCKGAATGCPSPQLPACVEDKWTCAEAK